MYIAILNLVTGLPRFISCGIFIRFTINLFGECGIFLKLIVYPKFNRVFTIIDFPFVIFFVILGILF